LTLHLPIGSIVGAWLVRWGAAALVVACGLIAPRTVAAQSLGGSCTTPGQLAYAGYVLVCSESGTFRYALHGDIPPPPDGGYTERPEWYPRLSEDLAAAYESRMQRLDTPRWGRIDHDVPGAASGNWFLAGTVGYSGRLEEDFRSGQQLRGGEVPGKLTYAWSHLAIVPHSVQPGRWIFSIGWWTDPRGDPRQLLLEVRSGQPRPSELTAASGVVVYRLWSWQNSPAPVNDAPNAIGYDLVPVGVQGVVALQVNSDGTLNLEVMAGVGDPATFRGFTAAKRTYRR